MSCASLALSPLSPSRNFLVPERAIVPRLSMTSSWFMPIPLSLTVNVPAAASGIKVTDISSAPIKPGFAIASKRSFSQASEAFEISSRRKISLCEYSEWMTKRSTCLVSDWNSLICGCVSVVMALQSLGLDHRYGRYPLCKVGSGFDTSSAAEARTCARFTAHDGKERHRLDCLGGLGRQLHGRLGEVRGCGHDRFSCHDQRGGTFAGRHRQRSPPALRHLALGAPGGPHPPLRLWPGTLFLELRGGPADLRLRRRCLGLRRLPPYRRPTTH